MSAAAKLIATIDFAMMALIHFSKIEWVECPRQLTPRSDISLVLCSRRPKRTVNQLTDAALENGFRMAVISLQNLERTEAK